MIRQYNSNQLIADAIILRYDEIKEKSKREEGFPFSMTLEKKTEDPGNCVML